MIKFKTGQLYKIVWKKSDVNYALDVVNIDNKYEEASNVINCFYCKPDIKTETIKLRNEQILMYLFEMKFVVIVKDYQSWWDGYGFLSKNKIVFLDRDRFVRACSKNLISFEEL